MLHWNPKRLHWLASLGQLDKWPCHKMKLSVISRTFALWTNVAYDQWPHYGVSSDRTHGKQRKLEIQFASGKIKAQKHLMHIWAPPFISRNLFRNLNLTANLLKYSHQYTNCPKVCHLRYYIQALGCWKASTLWCTGSGAVVFLGTTLGN